jgi:transposase
MDRVPDLSTLSHEQKDALIQALWAQVQALTAQVQLLTAQVTTLQGRVAELETKLDAPPKTPGNSSLPPSQGKKPNRDDRPVRNGPRPGSLGRQGGGRLLAEVPDETVTARPARCAHCQAALGEADLTLAARFDKVDLPKVAPAVTRVERYAGHCRCCGGTTLAPLPEGLEPGTPFSLNIVALAMYLRFMHHVSYRRLSRLLLELFGLGISEGALDAAFQRGKPRFDAETSAILARLRRARIVCSDGRKHCFRRRAHRRPRLLELGVPERRGGNPCDRPQPWRRRHRRGDGRAPPGRLGLRPPQRPARPCRGVADLFGASTARLPLRHRGGRHHLRPAHEGTPASRRGAGPPAPPLG